MRKKIIIERDPGEEPNCSNCLDIPLFGCVACPPSPSSLRGIRERIARWISDLEKEDEVYRSEQIAEMLVELRGY